MQLELKTLSDQCYQDEKLQIFLDKYKISDIIANLLQYDEKFEELLKLVYIIVGNQKFFHMILFADQELVTRLLTSNDSDIRKIISEGIKQNQEQIIEIMKNSEQSDDYTKVLFYLLNDFETTIGLAIQQFLFKMAKIQPQFYQNQLVQDYISQGMMLQDEILFRYCDVLIEASNKNEQNFKLFQKYQEQIIEFYYSKDILTSLNSIYAMIHMVDNQTAAGLILQSSVYKAIVDDIFKGKGEILKKNLQLQLLGKLIGNGYVKMDIQMQNVFLQNIRVGFQGHNNDDVASSLDVIGFLCQMREGIQTLTQDKEIFSMFLETSRSLSQAIKTKFLTALKFIFAQNANKKIDDLKQIFYCLGNQRLALQLNLKQVEKKIPEDEGQSIKQLCSWLYTIQEDQEQETLGVLMNICDYQFGIQEIAKNLTFPDYLGREHCRNKIIFDMKTDLKDKIIKNLPIFEKKDSIIKNFMQSLKEAQDSKKQEVHLAMEAK